jgi:diacylglycerol kinase (ATP)
MTVNGGAQPLRKKHTSVYYSFAGLSLALEQGVGQVEFVILVVGTLVACIFGKNFAQTAILTITLFLGFAFELLNTAVERTVDRIGYEYHELSRQAKDLASGAVFIVWLLVVFVWLIWLYDRVFQ